MSVTEITQPRPRARAAKTTEPIVEAAAAPAQKEKRVSAKTQAMINKVKGLSVPEPQVVFPPQEATVAAPKRARKAAPVEAAPVEEPVAEKKPRRRSGEERVEKNGIRLPREGTITYEIWSRFNEFASEHGRPLLINEALEITAGDFEKGTVGVQYNCWCIFYGVDKATRAEIRRKVRGEAKAAAEVEAAPAVEEAAPAKRVRKTKSTA